MIKSWRASISHVPQSIYLIDGTIAENIALARANKEIDYELIEYVSTIAQLSNFVRELPDQYQTNIGERGVKLSGGQRQRIGIARALYKRSSILILDEATSALDNQTESNLMKSLNDSYSNDTTIISIAHRLTSLNQCKRFIKIDSGRIVEDNHV
ncbi:hypothetical protein CL656_05030 [bacterium]|nr:hypothetical protein [bacterium]